MSNGSRFQNGGGGGAFRTGAGTAPRREPPPAFVSSAADRCSCAVPRRAATSTIFDLARRVTTACGWATAFFSPAEGGVRVAGTARRVCVGGAGSTIRVPGEQGATEVSLEQPGPPLHDEATAAQIRDLITKGAIGGLVFVTDDARGLYETLKERGVTDFTQEPTDHFYGTDMGIRDPFGNPIRILQQGKAREKATA